MWTEWTLCLMVLLLGGWSFRRIALYRRTLNYDPTISHRYPLEGEFVPIEGAIPGGSASSLVRIEVRATLPGKFFDPTVQTICGEEQITFVLERGAKGARYLCLPPFTAATLQIRFKHLRLVERPAIWVSKPVDGNEGPLLVVAPHPDDAEIAAYGLYRERPERAHIVTVTPGELGKRPKVAADKPGGWTSWLRRYDSLVVPRLAGVPEANVANLDFLEAELASPTSEEAIERLVMRLIGVIDRVRPTRIVCPHPLLDSHSVHRAVTRATLAAIARSGSSPMVLFCLIHVPKGRSYPLGTMDAGLALPPYTRDDPMFSRLLCLPLTHEVQTEKVFALEAHHDLRPAPAPYAKEPSVLTILRNRTRERLYGVGRIASFDYVRRAARPFEIFLVATIDEALAMLKETEK